MNYEDFCHIASVCTEQIGPKCRRFFSPSNFMKFEKDEAGRIAILPFYLYVMRTVSILMFSSYQLISLGYTLFIIAESHPVAISQIKRLWLLCLNGTSFGSFLLQLTIVYTCFNNHCFVTVQVSLTQARIDMSELDEDSDGFLQSHVSTQLALKL